MTILTRNAPGLPPTATTSQLKEAGVGAIGTLSEVVTRLRASDPDLAAQLSAVQKKLTELGIDLGAALNVAEQHEAKVDAKVEQGLPGMKAALDAELGKHSMKGFDGKAHPFSVANISVDHGKVYVQHDFHWSQHDAMGEFDKVVTDVMKAKFPGVQFQVIGNGLE